MVWSWWKTAAAVLVLALSLTSGVTAQRNEIAEGQKRLEQIRRERARLREEMTDLRSRVHDISSELAILRKQVSTSAMLLRELENQGLDMERQVEENTNQLLAAQDRLRERKAVLHRRIREIYKRGSLHPVEVLLSARSFSDLLARFKYLHLIAEHDRALVKDIVRLQQTFVARERSLERTFQDLEQLREQKEIEHSQLAALELQQRDALSSTRERERATEREIDQLAKDEKQVTALINRLEKKRKEAERLAAERRRAAAARGDARAATPPSRTSGSVGTLSASKRGSLAWPVDGSVLYRFGRQAQPNGTAIRWNGIGIAAALGTPVRAVEAGTVVLASTFEGYGPTVVIDHGGGYYTLYLYLRNISVREGEAVNRHTTLGEVGGNGTDQRPHVEFQLRSPGGQAVDPLPWLSKRSG